MGIDRRSSCGLVGTPQIKVGWRGTEWNHAPRNHGYTAPGLGCRSLAICACYVRQIHVVTASQADPLTTIQQLDPIYVDVTQSSAQLLALRRSLASGKTLPASATIRDVEPEDLFDATQALPNRYRDLGAESLRNGEVAVVTLAALLLHEQVTWLMQLTALAVIGCVAGARRLACAPPRLRRSTSRESGRS